MGKPVRTCAGCGRKRPRSEMIRVAVNGEGNVSVTGERGTPGRGSYVCREKRCVEMARYNGGMRRGLKASVPDTVFQELERSIEREQRGASG